MKSFFVLQQLKNDTYRLRNVFNASSRSAAKSRMISTYGEQSGMILVEREEAERLLKQEAKS